MLKAGVFDNFKGATTLLVWGDREGITSLCANFSALRDGTLTEFPIDCSTGGLTVCSEQEGSKLEADASGLRWGCSQETATLAAALVKPLLEKAGHQFLDVNGLAEQVIIARDEYPADLH